MHVGQASRLASIEENSMFLNCNDKLEAYPTFDRHPANAVLLAVMAFLSRGHMPDEGKYGPQISKAIDFVLSTQRRRGYFSLLPVTPPAGHMSPAQTVTYNHSIAGLMLGEVYGMTSGEHTGRFPTAGARPQT